MKDFKLDGKDLKEAKLVGISDLVIEGLEDAKNTWKSQCVNANNNDDIKISTDEYTKKIEEALNQPLAMVLKKANFTDINSSVIIDRDPGKKAMIRMRDDDATGKTLHEKAKSSIHGIALAGYIPVDQEFGKAGDSGQKDRFNYIVAKRFSDQMVDEDRLNSMVALQNEGKSLTKDQSRELERILSTNPVAKMQLKDDQGREIYGIREEGKAPVFAYKNKDNKFYNEKDGSIVEPPVGKDFKKIEVLSYISGIEKISSGKYQLKTQKITGDHDQLSVGTKLAREETFSDKALSDDKGFADKVGHAITTALIDETKSSGAVRHGQDSGGAGTKGSLSKKDLQDLTRSMSSSKDMSSFLELSVTQSIAESKLGGNPYPEDFAAGNYATYTPNGIIMVAHNEVEIVDKYNQLEAQGYNIGINPRYGWERDEDNKLHVDPDKVSAQSFIKAKVAIEADLNNTLPQDITPETRKEIITNVHEDSDKLYKMNSILSLIKLQEDSSEKKAAVLVATNILHNGENKYASEHGVVPPTISAMINERRNIKRKMEAEAIIVATPIKNMSEKYTIGEALESDDIALFPSPSSTQPEFSTSTVINEESEAGRKMEEKAIIAASPIKNIAEKYTIGEALEADNSSSLSRRHSNPETPKEYRERLVSLGGALKPQYNKHGSKSNKNISVKKDKNKENVRPKNSTKALNR